MLSVLRADAIETSIGGHYTSRERAAWRALPVDAMARAVHAGQGVVLVAEAAGRVQGYAWATTDGRAHLRSLYVAPSAGRRGLGSRLLRHIEQRVVPLGVDTLFVAASIDAVDFYRRHGYAAEMTFLVDAADADGPLSLCFRKMVKCLGVAS